MKVKVDSKENYPSVLHPRNLFWSVNLYMWCPTLVALLPEEDYEQAVALDINRFFCQKGRIYHLWPPKGGYGPADQTAVADGCLWLQPHLLVKK